MSTVHFPKWLYAAGNQSLIVQSQDEQDALEGNWYESPADVPEEGAEAVARADLIAKAETLGIAVDGRWSDKRIAAELAKVA